MRGERVKGARRSLAFIAVALTFYCWFSVSPLSPSARFAVLTLAIPSSEIPLPLQLVLAYGWQLQATKEGIGYPWWTLGGFGVTFVTDEGNVNDLENSLSRVWKRTDWDPLIVKQARILASQQVRVWMRDPIEWLRWQARVIAMGDHPMSLDPEQPNRVRLDDVSSVLRKLSRYSLPLLRFAPDIQSWSFTALPIPPPTIRTKFQQTLKLSLSQRVHGLWWTLSKGEPAVAIVVGEFLGCGTGAVWYQLLRGEKPIAYHAVAQVQWTPVGSELTLYAATTSNDFKLVRQRARQLLLDLSQGKINGFEFERARKLAELRLKQLTSDPVSLSRTIAIWLMSGRSLSDWESLPGRLQSLSHIELQTFFRSLPPASEIVASP